MAPKTPADKPRLKVVADTEVAQEIIEKARAAGLLDGFAETDLTVFVDTQVQHGLQGFLQPQSEIRAVITHDLPQEGGGKQNSDYFLVTTKDNWGGNNSDEMVTLKLSDLSTGYLKEMLRAAISKVKDAPVERQAAKPVSTTRAHELVARLRSDAPLGL